MFAVIKTGGKQYKVQQGDVLQVEKLELKKEKSITFEEVLLVEDGKKTLIGTPFVEKAKVHAVVIEHFKDDKVLVFKKKRRKQYKKKHGHRQELARIRIEDITVGGVAPKKAKPAQAAKKAEPEKAKPAAKKPAVKTEAKKTEAKKPAKKTMESKPKTKSPRPKASTAKPKTTAPKPKAAAAKAKTTAPKPKAAAAKAKAAPKKAAVSKPMTKKKEK